MWLLKDGKKALDITKVRGDFKITERDGLYLICPRKNLWDWEEEEKWLRSIVVDKNGFVKSCSWKKFGNYGEFLNDTKLLLQALRSGIVRFSQKEDGSLAIRSVINGKVIFRTRGTLYGGENADEPSYGEKFEALARDKYPILLDTNWMTDRSLLFEYVAPSNLVVVHYNKEDLIFLGFVKHDDLRIGEWEELEAIANMGNLNLVRLHDLPKDPLKLLEEIKNWKDEGVVVRCADLNGRADQVFVKVKSAFYLANHRMKFSMKYETIVEFVEGAEITSEDQLITELRKHDYDWEIIELAKAFYQEYVEACQVMSKCSNIAQRLTDDFFKNKICDELCDRSDPGIRKEFAKVACVQESIIRAMMFCLYDCKHERFKGLGRKLVLSKGKWK